MSQRQTEDCLAALEVIYAASHWHQCEGHICMAAQPSSLHGSPDDLVDDGVPRAAAVTGAWAERLVVSVEDMVSEGQVRSALARAADEFNVDDLAEVIFDEMLRSFELGALDSQWERENDREVAIARFRDEQPFTVQPRAKALELWEKRQVLPYDQYQALSDELKRRAFSFAGAAREEMLNVAHAELAKGMREGTVDLNKFYQNLETRLESAGWTPKSPTHLETIIRTNVVSANSAGRYADQTQPEVIAALPYWECRGVTDARQRKTHRAATRPPGQSHGIILPATHPFWITAYPPWGFNCRCRVIARTQKWIDRMMAVIGPPPINLPDPGFTGGGRGFVQVPSTITNPSLAPRPRAEAPKRAGEVEPTPVRPASPPPRRGRPAVPVGEVVRRGKTTIPSPGRVKPSDRGVGPEGGKPSWIKTPTGYKGFGFSIRDVVLRKTAAKRWELVLDGEVYKLPNKPTFDHAEALIRKAAKKNLPENFAAARAAEERRAQQAAAKEAARRSK